MKNLSQDTSPWVDILTQNLPNTAFSHTRKDNLLINNFMTINVYLCVNEIRRYIFFLFSALARINTHTHIHPYTHIYVD
jgi:hypothetical protein